MTHRIPFVIIFSAVLLLGGCAEEPTDPTPTLAPATTVPVTSIPEPTSIPPTAVPTPIPEPASGILFSEILVGVPGGNNHEFIELYNAEATAVDLNGWSLWYQNRADQDEQLVFSWDTSAHVPAGGHFLLIHEGQDFSLLPDASFGTPLFEGKGGLVLRDAEDNIADQFGWGSDVPPNYFAGEPAPVPDRGASLERLPGGEAGHRTDSGSNAVDFISNTNPHPQNSGSPTTPPDEGLLAISIKAPENLEPGVGFEYVVTINNETKPRP